MDALVAIYMMTIGNQLLKEGRNLAHLQNNAIRHLAVCAAKIMAGAVILDDAVVSGCTKWLVMEVPLV